MLSDGRDTTGKPISEATDAVKSSGVKVDAVTLSSVKTDTKPLQTIASAGDGSLLPSDPSQLTSIFQGEAQTLSQQVLITFQAPDSTTVTEGTLAVTLTAGGSTVSGSAFVTIQPPTSPTPTSSLEHAAEGRSAVSGHPEAVHADGSRGRGQ